MEILVSGRVINVSEKLLLTYEFFKTCKKKFRSHTYKLFCHGMLPSARPDPDQNFQTSWPGHCQTWARLDNRLPLNFSTWDGTVNFHVHCRSKLFVHLLFQLFLKCLNFYNNKLNSLFP